MAQIQESDFEEIEEDIIVQDIVISINQSPKLRPMEIDNNHMLSSGSNYNLSNISNKAIQDPQERRTELSISFPNHSEYTS